MTCIVTYYSGSIEKHSTISLTILNSIFLCRSRLISTLKDLLRENKSMNYGSIEYVRGWMIMEYQPTGIDYQQIRDENYTEDSMMQHYMEFDEDHQDDQDSRITHFLKQSLINLIRSIRQSLIRKGERNSSRRKIWWWYIWGKEESQLKSPYQVVIS